MQAFRAAPGATWSVRVEMVHHVHRTTYAASCRSPLAHLKQCAPNASHNAAMSSPAISATT